MGSSTRLLALVVAALTCAILEADEPSHVTVTGLLVDHDDRRPLPHMAIALDFGDRQQAFRNFASITDERGRFEIQLPVSLDPATKGTEPPEITSAAMNGDGWSLAACNPDRQMSMFAMVDRIGAPGVAEWDDSAPRTLVARVRTPGEFRATVRDHDGTILKNTDVHVAWESGRQARVGWRGQTDSKGQFRLRCRAQDGMLFVVAPGRGCAFVARQTVKPKDLTDLNLPFLMPLATVSGTVHADFSPGDEIEIGKYGWEKRHAVLQKDGRFEFRDVVPGYTQFQLLRTGISKTDPERETLDTLMVSPGQHITGLKVGVPDPFPIPDSLPPVKPRFTVSSAEAEAALNGRNTTFAVGRVTDVRGEPIPGARVIVTNQYHGGLRQVERTVETRSDENGKWRVDEVRVGYGSLTAAVVVPGRPVTFARGIAVGRAGRSGGTVVGLSGLQTVPGLASDTNDTKTEPHIRADAIVPDDGGSITIQVLNQQQPATSGYVQLRLTNLYQRTGFGWAREMGLGERELRDSTWQFTQPIDDQGMVRFNNLLPGEYTAYAVDGTEQDVRTLAESSLFRRFNFQSRIHRGMVSVADETRHYQMQLGPQHSPVPLKLIGPDGEPFNAKNVGINFQRLFHTYGRGTSRNLKDGTCEFSFESAGLWQLTVAGRAGRVQSIPVRDPEYSGTAIVGTSSLLPTQPPRRIHLRATKHSPEATLQIRDGDGQPARVFVRISDMNSDGLPVVMGTTDTNGELHFTGFTPKQSHAVITWPTDAPPLPPLSTSLNDDQFLSHRGPQVSNSVFRAGTQSKVRLQPQNYVRGRAIFPSHLRPQDYDLNYYLSGIAHDFDPTTGEFIVGPVAANNQRLVWRHRGTPANLDTDNAMLIAEVALQTNAVTHADVSPQPVRRDDLRNRNLRDRKPISGRVWLFDKGTPADGARFMAYAPNLHVPVSAGWSDPSGRVQSDSRPVPTLPRNPPIPNDITSPILIAWIPGKTGRAIVPLSFTGDEPDELDVILPRGIPVTGQVTIGGKSPLVVPAPVTVVLQSATESRVSLLTAQKITANADGSFAFNDLTPGRYVCQAALDDLWLSPSIELEVTDEPANVKLRIPSPGGTARVRFQRPDRSPWQRQMVEVNWPDGPLTRKLRPTTYTTDFAGELILDGAPVGTIGVRRHGDSTWHKVEITAPTQTPPRLQVVNSAP